MEKVREYEFEKIEVCRNCGGTGREKTIMGLLRNDCEVCNGSGRVRKTTEIRIKVKPFESPLPPLKGGRG